jgi:hypothetical protein
MNCGSVVYRFMMPRYCPELAPLPDAAPPPFAFSRLSWASARSTEARFGYVECEVAMFKRLISTPINAHGAHEATAHDLFVFMSCQLTMSHKGGQEGFAYTPQKAMMIVACLIEVTKGAILILPAKMQCAVIQAVSRLGLYFSHGPASNLRLEKPGPFSPTSGLSTKKGSRTDITNVTIEKETRAIEPILPTLPVRSPAALTAGGASYRR